MFNHKAEVLFHLIGNEIVPISELFAVIPNLSHHQIILAVESLSIDGLADVLYIGDEISEVCYTGDIAHFIN